MFLDKAAQAADMAEAKEAEKVKRKLDRLVKWRLRGSGVQPEWQLVAPDGRWTGLLQNFDPADRFVYTRLSETHVLCGLMVAEAGAHLTNDPKLSVWVVKGVPSSVTQILRHGHEVNSLAELGAALRS